MMKRKEMLRLVRSFLPFYPFTLLPFYLFTFLPFLLLSCEKEIDIDYKNVDALYVAEAMVTQQGTTVRLTKTRSVDVNSRVGIFVKNAEVKVLMGNDIEDQLEYNELRGLYESSIMAFPGFSYTIDIAIDGRHYTSTSTVLNAPEVANFRFVWKKMFSERMLFVDLHLHDIPNENNYYFMHLYRNGIGYRWAVMRDSENPGGELTQLFSCTTERAMDENSDADALRDGDVIHLEVRSIDKASYDYFYSLQLATSSNTNPLPNFTGGMLGYFSAFQSYENDYTFHRSKVEEEEDD